MQEIEGESGTVRAPRHAIIAYTQIKSRCHSEFDDSEGEPKLTTELREQPQDSQKGQTILKREPPCPISYKSPQTYRLPRNEPPLAQPTIVTRDDEAVKH